MPGKNKVLLRYVGQQLSLLLKAWFSALILGPRQTGKTTMAKSCLKDKKNTAEYPLQNPQVRLELETSPSRLIKQIEARVGRPVVFVD